MNNQQLFNDAHQHPEMFNRVDEISESELFKSTEQKEAPGNPFADQPQQAQPQTNTTEAPNNFGQTGQQDFNIGNFIDEKVAVEFVDISVPVLIGFALKSFMNKKVPKSQLQASQSEKELMYAPMKEVLKRVNIQVTNPFEALVYAAICVYGTKTAVACMDDAFDIPAKTAKKYDNGMSGDLNELAQDETPKKGRGRPRKS